MTIVNSKGLIVNLVFQEMHHVLCQVGSSKSPFFKTFSDFFDTLFLAVYFFYIKSG